MSQFSELKGIISSIQNMENTIARASGISSTNELVEQWSVVEKTIINATKLDGDFRKNANIGKIVSEYQKYIDMGGTNSIADISKIKDNEATINSILSKMKEVKSQDVENDSIQKLSIDLDGVVAKFDELISVVKKATNELYKIIKQGSVSDLDKQWSSISDRFKSIADESGKINLSKQKTEVKELMEMYQKYENAGGMNSLSSLTDNVDTIRKLDKEYQKLNQTQMVDNSLAIERESESFKNVEKSVDSLTTDSLVSMSQAFKELDKMEIIDVLDKIGNEYSISTDNLSRALQDSAAVLKTQGNDLAESVALLTAGNAINQDYSKTAGGVRTISLRLAGTEEAKDQLASLGEDVDDFIVQTNSKTQQLIKDYTAVASNAYQGIDVLDANGNLRNTYNILLDISKIYKEIQEEDKKAGTNRAQALVEYIAGKNRSNIASSILLNPELLESVYESAQNANGAAMKELDAYMESLDAKVAQFQNRLQELEADLVDSDFLKGAVDLGTEFIHILDNIVDTIGVIPTLAAGGGLFAGIKNVGVA